MSRASADFIDYLQGRVAFSEFCLRRQNRAMAARTESLDVARWDVISAALAPLPPRCLGVIASASQRFGAHARCLVARDALQTEHGISASVDDISFVFNKLDAVMPELLKGVPPGVAETVKIWPVSCHCTCGNEFGMHRRELPMVVFSSDYGRREGVALELHCDACGLYFLGQWAYNRGDRRLGKPISNLSFQTCGHEYLTFLLPTPGLHAVYGCTVQDLRLVSGTLLHARGSFHAAADIFADRADDAKLHSDTHFHQILEAMWYAWACHDYK